MVICIFVSSLPIIKPKYTHMSHIYTYTNVDIQKDVCILVHMCVYTEQYMYTCYVIYTYMHLYIQLFKFKIFYHFKNRNAVDLQCYTNLYI